MSNEVEKKILALYIEQWFSWFGIDFFDNYGKGETNIIDAFDTIRFGKEGDKEYVYLKFSDKVHSGEIFIYDELERIPFDVIDNKKVYLKEEMKCQIPPIYKTCCNDYPPEF